ncbi:neuronal acetylcholine receptor subunit alpha-10-like [Mytilus californianus]|uniref:neuronal acetylcholine receptor subunit alpha-10-like n=1 Tax=Mytilus californianus TaxID=6549 RepID=UPI002248496F|nr:neuronal acetylcholine receptor subunit alpha-10-like [Mytilus californianus]
MSAEHKLMIKLMKGYEKSIRPVMNSSEAVDIKLGLALTQILDLDEKNQVLTTNVWMEVEWYDQKLHWSSQDYEGMKSIRLPCDRLWLPDVVLYNSVDDYTSGYMPSLAMVFDSSRVFWGPVVRFRSSCKIDITYFPFDDQMCKLKLGSWAYHGLQVNVFNRSDTIDVSNLVDNGEWELIHVRVERNVIFYNCCEEPFPDVTFYVHLRRRVKYYFMNIIIPCIILSFLCISGFLLPPESGEKITLGLSVLLTITVFMLMVADKMPSTSESISVISIYLMVVLSMSCMSVLSSVWILCIHHQRGKPKRVPTWLKYLVFRFLAKIFCIRISKYSPKTKSKFTNVSSKSRVSMEETDSVRKNHLHYELMELSNNVESHQTDNTRFRNSMIDRDDNSNHRTERHESIKCLIDRDEWFKRLIDILEIKQSEDEDDEECYREWRDVAFVLDRLFFILFLILTSLSTLCILAMNPGDHFIF